MQSFSIIRITTVSIVFAAAATAQVPPGYEVVDISQADNEEHGVPRMNDCGEIVFTFGPLWADWAESNSSAVCSGFGG